MANYTIELAPSSFGYLYETQFNQISNHARAVVFDDDNGEFLIKFDISPLINYRKKQVIETYLYFKSQTVGGDMGGAFSWIQETFTDSTTHSTSPSSGIIFYQYLGIHGNYIDGVFPFSYYEAGAIGYGGQPAPRDLYSQLPIGLKINNQVKLADKKTVDWGFWNTSEVPHFYFSLSDWNPIFTPQFPMSGGFVNALSQNNFILSFDAFQSIDYPTATQASVEIKDVATGTVTGINVPMQLNLKGQTSVNIPIQANTMTKNKSYQWRAKLITDDVTTAFSNWADFTTSDSIPDAPTINSPNSSYLDASQPITLSWTHNNDTGTAQTAYDIDYQQNDGWVDIASHVSGSANTKTIAANTLESGNFIWRVRTYNTDNVPGPYATSAINIVQAKPQTPIIQSVLTVPHTTIAWQSSGQQAFELWVGDRKYYDYGTTKSYTIDTYLDDGNYTVKLRIQNSQGLWSDYATATVSIHNVPLIGDDILSSEPVPGGIRFSLSLPNFYGKYVGEVYVGEAYAIKEPQHASGLAYLLCDGVPIMQVSGTSFNCYTAAGAHEYKYRVTNGGHYYDSNAVMAEPLNRYALMAPLSSPSDFVPLSYYTEKPRQDRQSTKVFNTKYFSGRTQAVKDITEHYDVSWKLDYIVPEDVMKKIQSWHSSGETILFRNAYGDVIVGIITAFNSARISKEKFTVSVSISENDYSPEVAYV